MENKQLPANLSDRERINIVLIKGAMAVLAIFTFFSVLLFHPLVAAVPFFLIFFVLPAIKLKVIPRDPIYEDAWYDDPAMQPIRAEREKLVRWLFWVIGTQFLLWEIASSLPDSPAAVVFEILTGLLVIWGIVILFKMRQYRPLLRNRRQNRPLLNKSDRQ